MTCAFDMKRCYVLVGAAFCWIDWAGSVPCIAIWGWEGIGALDDIDLTTFGPTTFYYSPPCGPLSISFALAVSRKDAQHRTQLACG